MNSQEATSKTTRFVTVIIGGQLFGMPIERVHDVFMLDKITRVPRAEAEIAGVLNLRGRIVTAVDMHCVLGLEGSGAQNARMAVVIEYLGESYGFIIDDVSEVLTLADAQQEVNPSNLHKNWADLSAGVHRLEGELMVVLDVEKLLCNLIDRTAA